MSKRIYLDMDGVLASFNDSHFFNGKRITYYNHPEMYEEGFFESLPVMAGARKAVRHLMNNHDVWILSQPVKTSAHSYSEKALWTFKHFPELSDKIILTQDKIALSKTGAILIDDNAKKWKDGWEKNGGIFLHFDDGKEPLDNWKRVFEFLEL